MSRRVRIKSCVCGKTVDGWMDDHEDDDDQDDNDYEKDDNDNDDLSGE